MLGDFDTSAVIYGKFTTIRPSTGAPHTLAGTPALSVYKDASTTQSTTGVTLTADFDSVTGLNHFAIDTSADGTFYSAGSFFDIVITTGTVDSVSAVGFVVGRFTLRKTSALKPTTAGRTLDVSAGGEAGVDWANVGSPTTTLDLSGTTIKTATDVETDTADIQTRIPAALVSGRIDASVGAMEANTITAAAMAADAGAEIADAVWDEAISGHLSAGTTGAALNGAGSAGDPWTTSLPGAYGSGTAGYILGTNLDGTVSSRASQTSVNTVAGYVDTEVAAIKAKTDLIPAAPAAVGDIPTANQNADALLARNIGGGSSTGRTVEHALAWLRNRWHITDGILTVYDTDDTTVLWTAPVSQTPGDPVSGIDPA